MRRRPHGAGDDDVGPLARVGLAAPAHYDGPLIHRAKHFAMAVHQRVLQWRVWRRVETAIVDAIATSSRAA